MSEPSRDHVDSTGVFLPRAGEASSPPEPSLERALHREIHKTDLLRARLLAGVLALFLAAFVVLRVVVMEGFSIAVSVSIVVGLAAVIALELVTARQIRKSLDAGAERPPVFARYAMATVEALAISAVLLGGALHDVAFIASPGSFVYFFFIVAATLYLEMPLAIFTGAICAISYAAISVVAIEAADPAKVEALPDAIWRPGALIAKSAILFLCGVAAAYVGRETRKAALTALEKHERVKSIRALFGRFVSPEVAEKLLEGGGAGETREVCVMFVDIREFTRFSESRTPAEVVAYLNRLFDELVAVVRAHGGCVSKFLGDGFMAVFGAPLIDPDACRHAVDCARALLAKVEELNRAGALPPTRIGIGLHAGAVVAGEVGAEERKEYTVIGDTVNLAARIEALNKEFASSLLVSEDVLAAAGLAIPSDAISRGPMQVKGRTAPVRVVQLA